jgi:hypothetical protein
METIFTLGDTTGEDSRINLDELYDAKKQHDLNTLALYNRILARIHARIKTISRQPSNEQFCWYVIPEMIIGIPKYDNGACTAYILTKLEENGFVVRYTYPNLLFISWAAWCPSYVRAEIKKKTGVVIDGYGNKIEGVDKKGGSTSNDSSDPNSLMLNMSKNGSGGGSKTVNVKQFTNINSYKPTGLIYNESLLKTIEDNTRSNNN